MTSSGTKKPGVLFIISAPSGAGKSTLCRAVLNRFSDLVYSVSYTTRPQRGGEQNGVDYHFISKDDSKRELHKVVGLNGRRYTTIITEPVQTFWMGN